MKNSHFFWRPPSAPHECASAPTPSLVRALPSANASNSLEVLTTFGNAMVNLETIYLAFGAAPAFVAQFSVHAARVRKLAAATQHDELRAAVANAGIALFDRLFENYRKVFAAFESVTVDPESFLDLRDRRVGQKLERCVELNANRAARLLDWMAAREGAGVAA